MERSLKVFLSPFKMRKFLSNQHKPLLQVLEAALNISFEIVLTTLNMVDLVTSHWGFERLHQLVEGQ